MSCFDRDPWFFFLMIRRPPRSTQSRSSAASDVYKRQDSPETWQETPAVIGMAKFDHTDDKGHWFDVRLDLSLIHISEPTRLLSISYAVFCLKKKTPSNPSNYNN